MRQENKRKPFCWQCGKPLEVRDGQIIFAFARVGEQDVRVHKICRQGALDYQRFDSTPTRFSQPAREAKSHE